MECHPYFKDDTPLDSPEKELKSSAASISTANTAVVSLSPNDSSFQPGISFFIDAKGIAAIRLPTPSSQLEIPIHHYDGPLAYISTRERKCSGNAILSSPKTGDLISTTYMWGPNRDPTIRLLQSPSPAPPEIKMTGKWISRQQEFVAPNGSAFVWRYVRSKEAEGTLLVLEKKDGSSSGPVRRIAQLVRNEHTRPAGTSGCAAGNGGELVFVQGAELELDEALIIATCILMLKKEVDRRRAIQIAAIAGVI